MGEIALVALRVCSKWLIARAIERNEDKRCLISTSSQGEAQIKTAALHCFDACGLSWQPEQVEGCSRRSGWKFVLGSVEVKGWESA